MTRFLSILLALLFACLSDASDTNVTLDGITFSNAAPVVFKGLWKGRSKSVRDNGLNRGLGEQTEMAVLSGLRWLASSQNKDGSWGDKADEREALTGVALLAFFGHGETPKSMEFGRTVEEGLKYLASSQKTTNHLDHAEPTAISHAIAAWALCEGYALTAIPHLKTTAEERLTIILKGQRPSGLWDGAYRMEDGQDDMEASIWQVLALQGGKMAGIQHDGLQEGLNRAVSVMEKALKTSDRGTLAGVVLCMQLCGQGYKPLVRIAIGNLYNVPPDWDTPSGNPIFERFLTTHALFHNGGKPWETWNHQFVPLLVDHQVKQDGQSGGKTVGYWDSPGKNERFGRVYATSLSILMLEVHYQVSLTNKFPPYEIEQAPASTNDAVIKIEL